MELCPRRFLTSSSVKPCARRNVAAACRRSWKRMCGSPARSSARANDRVTRAASMGVPMVFDARMAEAGETQRGNCREGEPGVELDFAYFFRGCFRSGGRAHIRYVQAATDCTFGQSHLKAGDVTLRQPALYIAVVGKGNDIERLDRWGSGGLAVPLRGQAPRLGCGGA